MKRYWYPLMILLAALGGCGSDSASYMVAEDREHAMTIFRDQSYPGADWELAIVLARLPDCQRRHPLKAAPSDQPYQAALYADADAEGFYLLHSDRTWYEVQLNACGLKPIEPVDEPPATLVGTWQERDGKFKFFPAGKAANQ